MSNNLKVGDTVMLSEIGKSRYIRSPRNPHSGKGEVKGAANCNGDDAMQIISVEWDSGCRNGYDSDELVKVSSMGPASSDITNLLIHCNGIESVDSSITTGCKQQVELAGCRVDSIIEQIGSKLFFNAFGLDELAGYLIERGYKVEKDDE